MDNLIVYFWAGWLTPEVIQEMGDAWRAMWYNKALKAKERGTMLYVFEVPTAAVGSKQDEYNCIAGIERYLQEKYPDHVIKVKTMLDAKG